MIIKFIVHLNVNICKDLSENIDRNTFIIVDLVAWLSFLLLGMRIWKYVFNICSKPVLYKK